MARNASHVTALQFAPGYLAFTRARAADQGFRTEGSAVDHGQWDPSDGSLARALGEFVRRHGLADDALHYVLPRHEAAARIVELPSQNADELRGMVHLSAEEIVPYPLDELLTAYTVLEALPGGSSRVLAVVVKKSVVESALNVIAAAGLQVEQVLFSTAALITALDRASLPTAAAVLHVLPDGFEVAVLREGSLASSRGLSMTIGTAPSADVVNDLVSEFRASLGSSRRESPDAAPVSEILLSSTGVDTTELLPALQAVAGVPVRPGHDLVAYGAIADAFGARRHHIALTPESEIKRRAAAGMRSRLIRLAAAAAVGLAATIALYGQTVMQRRAYVSELDARAEQMRPLARTLLNKRQQLRLIEERVDRSLSPLRLLEQVTELAPDDGLNISRIAFDRTTGLVVSGSATDPKLFDGLIDSIRGTGAASFPQFARARELYRTARTERGQQVWDFAVTIPFQESD